MYSLTKQNQVRAINSKSYLAINSPAGEKRKGWLVGAL
jgi:hypothetical protein